MQNETPDKIVLKCVNWVGDTIIVTPTIRAIRRRFPEARITAIARPWVAPLLQTNPDVDEVWEEKSSSLGNLRRMARRMRGEAFDLGFAFPNSFASALLLWSGGVKRRIGYARDGRAPLLTDPVPLRRPLLEDHEVKYYYNLLGAIGDVSEPPPSLVLEEDPDAAARIDELLESEGIAPKTPLIGINPGAFYGTAKRWAPDRFAVVARRLSEALGGVVVITGTENERPAAQEVCEVAGCDARNLAGRMNLSGLISLVKRMSAFVTNDSGAMHIAAALDVPTVAVFGSTDWITTPPWSDNAILVRRDTACAPCLLRHCPIDHRCMERVTVRDVLEAIRRRWPEWNV